MAPPVGWAFCKPAAAPLRRSGRAGSDMRVGRPKRATRKVRPAATSSPESKQAVQEIAAERFVGAPVMESVAVEAKRRKALEWLLERAPAITDDELDAFMRELRGG